MQPSAFNTNASSRTTHQVSRSSSLPTNASISTVNRNHYPLSTAAVSQRHLQYTGPTARLKDSIGVDRIITMIRGQVGVEDNSPIPGYLCHAKLQSPLKYEGKDNNSKFNVWLNQVLDFCRKLRLCGPDADSD